MLPDTRMYLPLKGLTLAFLQETKIYLFYIFFKICALLINSLHLNANHKIIKIRYLLIFGCIGLNDQDCENMQEQAEQCYTDFVHSAEDGSPDGKALTCGTAQALAVRHSQRAGDTQASHCLPGAQQQSGVV